MITGFMLWNEPDNLSPRDFEIDSDRSRFAEMTIRAVGYKDPRVGKGRRQYQS